jgi:diphthamide biosynthesis protein 2
MQVIEHLKQIIRKAGKKFYFFSVGKLNVAKLANFPEIDVFVLVACPENSLIDGKVNEYQCSV